MEPGLQPAQRAPSKQWIDAQIDEALALKQKLAQGAAAYATQSEMDAEQAKFKANPFSDKINTIFENAKGNQKFIDDSIASLKTQSYEAAEKGVPPKSFWQVLGDAFKALNPLSLIFNAVMATMSGGSFLGSIWDALKGNIKDAALSSGSDWLAPWLKSMKDTLTGDSKSVDQARSELAMENAGRGLANFLGKDEAGAKDLVGRMQQNISAPPSTSGSAGVDASTPEALERARQAYIQAVKDKDISKQDISVIAGAENAGRLQNILSKAAGGDNYVLMAPQADDKGNLGPIVFANKASDGTLTNIQVSTTNASGEIEVRQVTGSFNHNTQGVGDKILQAAERVTPVSNRNDEGIVADSAFITLSPSYLPQQQTNQGPAKK
ncbi:MAG: hypothetical protein SFT92_07370 [Rickettsiales bacterium]|nr:hypothetical protein [Rickettsiales bacterium]